MNVEIDERGRSRRVAHELILSRMRGAFAADERREVQARSARAARMRHWIGGAGLVAIAAMILLAALNAIGRA